MTVTIDVSRDGWTDGVQLSIGDDNGGYRLAGPKFNGSSETLGSVKVDTAMAARALAALDNVQAAELVTERLTNGSELRLSLVTAAGTVVLAGAESPGQFRFIKRAKLGERDIDNVVGYLREAA